MASRGAGFDIGPATRIALICGTGIIIGLSLYAMFRVATGLAPRTDAIRDVALAVHLATVIPAMPLGLYVFLNRKGTPRHKRLGRIWLALMATTATASLFIHEINAGGFSPIHLLSVITLVSVPRAIWQARQGNIAAHRRGLLMLFTSAIVVAGLFTFLPGRLMWIWAFG